MYKWSGFSKTSGKLEWKAITLKEDYDQGCYLSKISVSSVFWTLFMLLYQKWILMY